MTVKITGLQFDEIVPEIQDALDTALGETLFEQQGALNKHTPVDTARMASSWQIGHNARPTPADRGEGWNGGVQRWEYTGAITFDGSWFISNAVPYAQAVCLLGSYPPSWGGKAPGGIPTGWFTTIANQTGNVFIKQFDKVKP